MTYPAWLQKVSWRVISAQSAYVVRRHEMDLLLDHADIAQKPFLPFIDTPNLEYVDFVRTPAGLSSLTGA